MDARPAVRDTQPCRQHPLTHPANKSRKYDPTYVSLSLPTSLLCEKYVLRLDALMSLTPDTEVIDHDKSRIPEDRTWLLSNGGCGGSTVGGRLWGVDCGGSTVGGRLWGVDCGGSTVGGRLWGVDCGGSTVGGSTVEVTRRYMSTSTIQVFAMLSSVIFFMPGSLAEC